MAEDAVPSPPAAWSGYFILGSMRDLDHSGYCHAFTTVDVAAMSLTLMAPGVFLGPRGSSPVQWGCRTRESASRGQVGGGTWRANTLHIPYINLRTFSA